MVVAELAVTTATTALAEISVSIVARLTRALDPLGQGRTRRGQQVVEQLQALDFFQNLQTNDVLDALPAGVSLAEVINAVKCPQGRAAISQLVSSRMVTPDQAISGQITRSLSYTFNPAQPELARVVVDTLAAAVDRNLATLQESDPDAYVAISQAAGMGLIASTLQALESHAAPLTEFSDTHRLQELSNWEKAFRSQVKFHHGHIVPPDFERKLKVPIDDLYVAPQIKPVSADLVDRGSIVDIEHFYSRLDRAVLLGDPGGGKSTASAWIATHAAGKNDAPVPFIVTLREYARDANNGQSIADYIETQASALYQSRPPVGAVEFLLASGRAMVIFDGLDELLDTSKRREITSRVELFSQNYPQCALLVTSRRVGYAEAALDSKIFATFLLAGFGESEVEEYVRRWFRHVDNQDGEKLDATCSSFADEASTVNDLTATPLILSLLCIIYRGQGYMPKNRPSVYEKCATLLFEQWDNSRQIDYKLRAGSQVDNAMKHLALWMLTSDGAAAGVRRDELVLETARLLSSVIEDTEECKIAAKEFVDFCKGRAWVLSDAGTTAEGEELYKFTHRTFMEYFAAYELTRQADSAEDLAKVLLPRIARGEWDVVAQLAVQIMDKSAAGGAERVLRRLLGDKRRRTVANRDSIHGFIWRCLSFIRVGDAFVRDLAYASFETSQSFDFSSQALRQSLSEPSLTYACLVMPEAFGSVSRILAEVFVQKLESPEKSVRQVAAATIGSWGDGGITDEISYAVHRKWSSWVLEYVMTPDSPVLGRETDIIIWFHLFSRRMVPLADFHNFCRGAGLRTEDYLFSDAIIRPHGFMRVNWGAALLNSLLLPDDGPSSRALGEFELLADILPVSCALPFVATPRNFPFFAVRSEGLISLNDASARARWGICLTLMIGLESESHMRFPGEPESFFGLFLRARRGDPEAQELALEWLSLPPEESAFVSAWMSGLLSVTAADAELSRFRDEGFRI